MISDRIDAPLEKGDIYADWSAADWAALNEIQAATRTAIGGYHDCDTIDWICEETLWQIRALLVRRGQVRLPQCADLTLSAGGGLRALPHVSLVREG